MLGESPILFIKPNIGIWHSNQTYFPSRRHSQSITSTCSLADTHVLAIIHKALKYEVDRLNLKVADNYYQGKPIYALLGFRSKWRVAEGQTISLLCIKRVAFQCLIQRVPQQMWVMCRATGVRCQHSGIIDQDSGGREWALWSSTTHISNEVIWQ